MESTYIFAIFPYLKTSNSLSIRGIQFRSSSDIDSVPIEIKEHLETIFAMFFLRDNLRIKDMTYTYIKSEDKAEEIQRNIEKLIDIQTLIAYLYSSPHPTDLNPYLKKEHSNMFFLIPRRVVKGILCPDNNVENIYNCDNLPEADNRYEIPGYEGRLNNESQFFVAKGNRLYPPTPNLWLNIPQDLFNDMGLIIRKNNGITKLLSMHDRINNNEKRIFTSLKWYNRSICIDVSPEIELINLAIAFECLLGLEQGEQVTKRFKESIKLLVGSVDKLDSWLNQFYKARSEIVHDGSSTNLLFNANADAKKNAFYYRSLVSYGRMIFKVCLNAIVTGSDMAYKIGLSNLFITNRERFENIIKKLNNKAEPDKLLLSIGQDVRDIESYRFVGESGLNVELIISALKKVVETFIETNEIISDELYNLMREFCKKNLKIERSKDKNEKIYNDLSFIRKIEEEIKDKNIDVGYNEEDINEIVFSFIKIVWHYTFIIYFRLDKKFGDKEKNNDC
ncbi:hypothetical protein AB2063_002572 [Clostridium botulinum]